MAFLKVTNVNIQTIGTDPRAAMDFRNRTANSGPLKKGLLTAAEGLETVTQTIATNYFDANIDVDDPEKHNDHYLHIQIRPKTKDDMLEFNKAELVLWKNNKDPKFADQWMLPARLWFQNPNKDQIMWEFKNLTTKTKLLPADFKAPGFPDKEWKSEWRRPAGPDRSAGAARDQKVSRECGRATTTIGRALTRPYCPLDSLRSRFTAA